MASQLTSQTCSYLVRMMTTRGVFAKLSERLTDKRSAWRVAEAQRLLAAAEEALLAAVAAERNRGVSWEAIGEALGITRSTAHGRFADRLEASDKGTDAERALHIAWQQVHGLAETHLTPLTHSISELEPEARQHASGNLLAAAMEPSFPIETRITAAQMLATVEHGRHSQAMERLLQEAATQLGSPESVSAPSGDLQIAQEGVSPARLLNLSEWNNPLSAPQGGATRSTLINEAIQGFEALLQKISADGADHPARRRAAERLAALLLIRFDELADPGDLALAIQHLRGAHAARHDFEPSESAELLAIALTRSYEQGQDPADLAEAVALLKDAVDGKRRAYGADHPETFRVRFELAQSLVRSGDPAQASRLFAELLSDQVGALGADHPDMFRTRRAYALSLSESGDHARAEQILAELVASQARVLGADHQDTTATRAHLLKVMARRLKETGDAELIERLDVATWSMITDGLTRNPDSLWPALGPGSPAVPESKRHWSISDDN